MPINRDTLPKMLYHACDGSVIEKIKKLGLSPKTNNKIEVHPDRVYFCTTVECVKSLTNNKRFTKKTVSDTVYLLTIDMDNLDHNIDFYTDPSHKDAIYTNQNISPRNIKISGSAKKLK